MPLPQKHTISLCTPTIQGNEWKYIKECLDTGWVSSVGSFVNRFEEKLATYVGTEYAVATVNGTSALHTAILVSGIQPNDEILVSTLTFIAPVNAIRYAGAYPIFIDAEPDYWQMDPKQVAHFLQNQCQWIENKLINTSTQRQVKAIMPVHILGHPVDMTPLLKLASKYNLIVIEDATESLGASYKTHKVGTLGHLACFSFNGNKLITTGGGGMIVTNDANYTDKARYLTTQAKNDPIEYIHNEIGYNYRLTNLQAAMGCAQLEQIETYLTKKRHIAQNYTQAFHHVEGIQPMKEAPWAKSAFWLYTILITPEEYGKTSRELQRKLSENNIQTRFFWQPIHLSPAHQYNQTTQAPIAENLYNKGLSLPCSVHLSEEEQTRVIELITQT